MERGEALSLSPRWVLILPLMSPHVILGQTQEASISFSPSGEWRPRLAYLTKLLRDSKEIRGVAPSRGTKWDMNVTESLLYFISLPEVIGRCV